MTAKQKAGLKQIALQLEALAIAFHNAADGIITCGNINRALENTADIVAIVREDLAQ